MPKNTKACRSKKGAWVAKCLTVGPPHMLIIPTGTVVGPHKAIGLLNTVNDMWDHWLKVKIEVIIRAPHSWTARS